VSAFFDLLRIAGKASMIDVASILHRRASRRKGDRPGDASCGVRAGLASDCSAAPHRVSVKRRENGRCGDKCDA
jgi:hypothetical protein